MRKLALWMAMLCIISSVSTTTLNVNAASFSDKIFAEAETEASQETKDETKEKPKEELETEKNTQSTPPDEEAQADEIQSDTLPNDKTLPIDISQGSVPFIDEKDPAMANLCAYMVELKTGTIIHSRNAEKKAYPASLTKVMTAILTLENMPDLNQKIKFTAALQDYVYLENKRYGGGISTGGIVLNESLTVEQLLYAIMLPSANEAAVMLANEMGGGSLAEGSLERFAEMMNEKAKEIGCKNTNFVNSNGLFDENHYTTAYDMYLITKYALEDEKFRQIVATPSYDTGETDKHDNLHWDSTNKLLVKNSGYFSPEIAGVKTGSLDESGKCLISTAQKDGYEYMLVLLGAPIYDKNGTQYRDNQAFIISKEFYKWAFETYKAKTIVEKGETVSSINKVRLAKGGNDHLQLMSGQTFSAILPNNIDVSNVRRMAYNLNGEKINSDDFINAPVEKGTVLGEMRLMLYGSVIGTVELLAAENVEVSPVMAVLDQMAIFFKSFWFKFMFLFLALFVMLYILLLISKTRKKKKMRKVNRRRRM